MPFEKGHKKATGRPEGSVNKLTKTVKEVFSNVFNEMQEKPNVNLLEWGEKNPTEFYKIASKLIPTELDAKVQSNVIKVVRE
jgi:hypothetical protein